MKDFRQLPGPKGNFFLGNALQLNKNILGFFTHCAEQYGEIVPLRLGLSPACLINKPEYIEQILQKRELFVKNTPDYLTLRNLTGQGLVSSEGNYWLRQRRMIQPVFHQQRINAYAETMVDYTKDLILTWKEGEIRDIHQDLMHLTLNIVSDLLPTLTQAYKAGFPRLTTRFSWLFPFLVLHPPSRYETASSSIPPML